MRQLKFILCLFVLISASCTIIGQSEHFTEEYKTQTIHRLCEMMNERYVFPDVAKKTEEHLLAQLKSGHFDQFKDDEAFAGALTESVQMINKDKHMRIRKNPPYVAEPETPERMIEERLARMKRSRNYNAGFHSAKVLEGNVGYLDLRGFAYVREGRPMADAYMKTLANTDAVIVDLRKNGGGDPETVQYLCSYFFDDKVHLNSLYFREGDRTIDYWTIDVDGEKMADVPLYVLTSQKTFSGAEEFSYNMQTQNRAILIGQTTGGGANPGGSAPINEHLTVFIPTGRAINPITKTNWEGIGVKPEFEVEEGQAFDKAYEMAKEAAEVHRKRNDEKHMEMYMAVVGHLEEYNKEESEKNILESLEKCKDAGLIEEWDINGLGYQYLMEEKKPKIAKCIFKANTILHPQSANVFDSYAESFAMEGDHKSALKYYEQAVQIAKDNEDPQLEMFQENLMNFKKSMKEGK